MDEAQKIFFVGPAWPYRGGIATIIETLARLFAVGWQDPDGVRHPPAEVKVLTFSVQYPRLLFPGRSQFRDGPPPEGVQIERVINTLNPLNWLRVGLRLRREAPDAVILKYWTPWMAPCFGTIARVAKWGGGSRRGSGGSGGSGRGPRFIVQVDNIIPHERRWFDGPLTRWFTGAMDGYVVMSEEVGRQLDEFDPEAPRVYSPHPMFDHFGDRVPREEACRELEKLLGATPDGGGAGGETDGGSTPAATCHLDPATEYVMFFGLVREYKGLDLLLDAWARVRAGGRDGAQGRKLLIVGEFYDDVARYRAQIERLGLGNEVIVYDRFVPDDKVALWFSLADVLVLPYRTATQSGVTQIAYHFDVPMIVTRVGGLPEIVRDGVVGLVAEPNAKSIAETLERFFSGDVAAALRANFATEKQRFSWAASARALIDVLERA